jgi:hypothetical protein
MAEPLTTPSERSEPVQKAWFVLYACVGSLVTTRNSLGDVVASPERITFWVVLGMACRLWWRHDDLPPSMSSFLTVLVGAVFGHSALSTLSFAVRRVSAASDPSSPKGD